MIPVACANQLWASAAAADYWSKSNANVALRMRCSQLCQTAATVSYTVRQGSNCLATWLHSVSASGVVTQPGRRCQGSSYPGLTIMPSLRWVRWCIVLMKTAHVQQFPAVFHAMVEWIFSAKHLRKMALLPLVTPCRLDRSELTITLSLSLNIATVTFSALSHTRNSFGGG